MYIRIHYIQALSTASVKKGTSDEITETLDFF